MNEDYWRGHIIKRSDLTSRLCHLTRSTLEKSALEVLYDILDTKTLKGSTSEGFIIGDDKAVCFQDIPLYSIAENIQYEDEMARSNKSKIHYECIGLRFNKALLFINKGARPVIYGPKDELKGFINEKEFWRIVNLDYTDSDAIIDWTHEREWRVKGDVQFEYEDIEIVLGTASSYKAFIRHYQYKNPQLLAEIQGIVVLDSLLK